MFIGLTVNTVSESRSEAFALVRCHHDGLPNLKHGIGQMESFCSVWNSWLSRGRYCASAPGNSLVFCLVTSGHAVAAFLGSAAGEPSNGFASCRPLWAARRWKFASGTANN